MLDDDGVTARGDGPVVAALGGTAGKGGGHRGDLRGGIVRMGRPEVPGGEEGLREGVVNPGIVADVVGIAAGFRGGEGAGLDRVSHDLHIVGRGDRDGQFVGVVHHVFLCRNGEVARGDDGRGDDGRVGAGIGLRRISLAGPVRNGVSHRNGRRDRLLASENLHVDGNLVPVVALKGRTMERNLVIVILGPFPVVPGDDELEVGFVGGAHVPERRIAVEGNFLVHQIVFAVLQAGDIQRFLGRYAFPGAIDSLADIHKRKGLVFIEVVGVVRQVRGVADGLFAEAEGGQLAGSAAEGGLPHGIDHIDGHAGGQGFPYVGRFGRLGGGGDGQFEADFHGDALQPHGAGRRGVRGLALEDEFLCSGHHELGGIALRPAGDGKEQVVNVSPGLAAVVGAVVVGDDEHIALRSGGRASEDVLYLQRRRGNDDTVVGDFRGDFALTDRGGSGGIGKEEYVHGGAVVVLIAFCFACRRVRGLALQTHPDTAARAQAEDDSVFRGRNAVRLLHPLLDAGEGEGRRDTQQKYRILKLHSHQGLRTRRKSFRLNSELASCHSFPK